MNHRIIEIDGRVILLDRLDDWGEEQPHRVWVCTWVDDLHRYDEHYACSSVRVAQKAIADTDEAWALNFLKRADLAVEGGMLPTKDAALIGPH